MKAKRKPFFERFWDAFWRPEMLILPGQISFFLFLSLVPTITLIGYACSYLNISNNLVSTLLRNTLGSDYTAFLEPILTASKMTPAFFVTLAIGYFIASNGMASIIVASNTIYGIKDSGFFRRRFKAIIMEIIIVILVLFILIAPLLGNSIINLLRYFNLDVETTKMIVSLLNFLKGPFSWVFIFLFIKIIFTMAPDKKIPSRNVTGGAIFTTFGWVVITDIYSYYISHYANYSVFYGSLANIVILMLWVYFLSYILVIGMAMNYHEELEKTGILEVQKIIASAAQTTPSNEETPKNEEEEPAPVNQPKPSPNKKKSKKNKSKKAKTK